MADDDDGPPPDPGSPCEAEKALVAQAGATKTADGNSALGSLYGLLGQFTTYEQLWAQTGGPLYLEVRGHRANLLAQIDGDTAAWNDIKAAFESALNNLSCSATNWEFLLGVLWEKFSALQQKAAQLQWSVGYWSNTLTEWHGRAYPQ